MTDNTAEATDSLQLSGNHVNLIARPARSNPSHLISAAVHGRQRPASAMSERTKHNVQGIKKRPRSRPQSADYVRQINALPTKFVDIDIHSLAKPNNSNNEELSLTENSSFLLKSLLAEPIRSKWPTKDKPKSESEHVTITSPVSSIISEDIEVNSDSSDSSRPQENTHEQSIPEKKTVESNKAAQSKSPSQDLIPTTRPPVSMSKEYQKRFFSVNMDKPHNVQPPSETLQDALQSKIGIGDTKPEGETSESTNVEEVPEDEGAANEYLLTIKTDVGFDNVKKLQHDYLKMLRLDQFSQLDCLNEEENENSIVEEDKNPSTKSANSSRRGSQSNNPRRNSNSSEKQRRDSFEKDGDAESVDLRKFSIKNFDKNLLRDHQFLSTSSNSSEKVNDSTKPLETLMNTLAHELADNPDFNPVPTKDETTSTSPRQDNISTSVSNIICDMPPSTYDDIISILHVLNDNNTQTKTNEIFETNNLDEILSYLDEVDRTSSINYNAGSRNFESNTNHSPLKNKGCLPTLDDLLRLSPIDLAHEVLGLRLQLEEKLSSVRLLQETLAEQQNSSHKTLRHTEQEYKKKLRTQKDEYEGVVKRHQKFIDQLIHDKKSLSDQCEKFIQEIKTIEEKHGSAMKAADHRHNVELQRVKDMCAAGEKLRREKWIEGKTQRIKEMTVKGLEPELNQLQTRHQTELSDLRLLHKQEIEELELRAARKTQQQLEALKEQMTNEREQAITNERERMREQYEKQSETEEKNYQELRRRLNSDMSRAKERLEQEYASRFAECQSREELVARDKERALECLRNEYDDKINELTRKHNSEINKLTETFETETERWKTQFKKEQKVWISEMESEIRGQCRAEFERELANTLQTVRAESSDIKRQMETLTDNRIKRLKEKYDKEIVELERSEKQALAKYVDVKQRFMESEESIINLKNKLSRVEADLENVQRDNTTYQAERSRVKALVREELQVEIDALEKTLLKMKQDHDNELKQIHTRVKLAIGRKDEAIQRLTKDMLTTKDRCNFLEQLLEQQRRDYLIKK